MADYVSKYTGNEVDGILDEAIELPQATSDDEGKFLKYDSSGIIWDNPIDTSNASDGDILKYNSNYGFTWDSLPEGLPVHNNGEFDSSILTINNYGDVVWHKAQVEGSDGQYLKYSENRGIIWDNPIDTDEASEGDFLRYGSNGLEWDNPLDIDGASQGQFLKYTGDTHDLEWGDPIDTSGASDGDVLKYDQYNGIIWDTPIDTDGASEGEFLKYGFNGLEWDKPIDTSNANNGEVLKYSSNTGIMWGNPLDTSGADDGEVLKYSSNTGIMWGSVSGTLPEYNGDETVLLTMASGNPNWVTLGEINIIPYYNSSYAGKVLTVLDNGSLSWESPNQ